MVPEAPTAKTSVGELPQTPLRLLVVPLVIGPHSPEKAVIGMRKRIRKIICICISFNLSVTPEGKYHIIIINESYLWIIIIKPNN
jgi:hypothetical protein